MSDEPRVYVASLSDYNAGRLVGEWISANQDPEDFQAAITAMLAKSTEYPAEEWAFHDYDNMVPGLGEYESAETVTFIGRAIGESDDADAMRAFLYVYKDHAGDYSEYLDNPEGFVERFQECYRGKWDSWKDFAQDDEIGDLVTGLSSIRSALHEVNRYGGRDLSDLVDKVEMYIDWDKVAHELEIGGTYDHVKAEPYGIHIFEMEA